MPKHVFETKKCRVVLQNFNFLLLPANIQYFSVLINGQLSKGCRFGALRDLRDTRLTLLRLICKVISGSFLMRNFELICSEWKVPNKNGAKFSTNHWLALETSKRSYVDVSKTIKRN